ncbi:unnamed protein product [Caenorhabditis auriculariae]|uniref:Solute carrier organic anion transporter family member n=1 Tax=Caenorhabditis auriculariae TaxID=2777116 RepID=A0A8S1GXR2_9PELO|nr:unnamed protein product [Caenorhabditis auriculariae]
MEKHNTESFEADEDFKASMDEDEQKLLCGYGGCTPSWIQSMHNAKCLLVMLGICAFIQSFVVNAIFPVGLSTLERRFKMTSTHTGIISSWYDFAVLLVVFPVCHWGNSGHKGRWIGWGGVVMALGSLICALPHWMVDVYHPDAYEKNETDFAIHAVLTSFGPVIGVFAGGFLLNLYDDFDRVDRVPMERSDPRWVGAWWVGFLISSISALLIAFPILAFARELPEAKRHRAKDVNQCHATNADVNEKAPRAVKNLPACVTKICKNPTFVVCIFVGIFESIIINGFAAFMPKILETLLSTNPTLASYLSSVVIFAAAAGVMVGGTIIRQLKLQVAGMLKMIVVCHVIALIFISGLLSHCPQREFVGINMGYNDLMIDRVHDFSTAAQCNENCHCPKEWNPVCDTNTHHMYYSACHAGCKKRHFENGTAIWTSCNCISSNETFHGFIHPEDHVDERLTNGYCNIDCGYREYILMVTLFITVVASFASGIPTQQIMLRVVPFDQRTLAMGVNWTFVRLLGFIPGGVLFGMIIDTTCLEWGENCGKAASCLVYDPVKLSWTITAVAIVCKLLSILATVIGYMTYRPSDLDNAASVHTVESYGALHLVVNDDRLADQPIVAVAK